MQHWRKSQTFGRMKKEGYCACRYLACCLRLRLNAVAKLCLSGKVAVIPAHTACWEDVGDFGSLSEFFARNITKPILGNPRDASVEWVFHTN
ncbi:hypothetical protein BS47DRAFT_1336853 [Hydnum rufescens UP504]|uniref:Uncharacterized protein n=1 Tax=Hydnum rufescens UP504 TaxID=1448309 RepID=A0A9P6B8J2_9AGAM|nr:hypothetical protein BS47DRAFT_1336853 [Hydnum rufescens UP504]